MTASGEAPSLPSSTALDGLPEPVRLVVWDLDDTFWKGTLSEGGAELVAEHEAIVIELARRGIMSSICSKNDAAAVVDRFAGREVWDYFIFPQIDWEAKGPKLRRLVDTVGLRPESMLFIDDNHLNRQEAAHFAPGMQVADETVIPHLLGHPMLRGKDDAALSRLNQYKLLEQRHADEQATAGGTEDFLRASGIVVEIDYDVEKHLDRAIELINRTNQLNFTKNRLPDDPAAARAKLIEVLGHYNIQGGMIRVRDNYGDYGFVGLYIELKAVHPGSHLYQFCFSCRVLGMKIETWLYRKLGRPPIAIVGPVVSDILETDSVIDWISLSDGEEEPTPGRRAMERTTVLMRGGCELMPLEHYCEQLAERTIAELAYNREGVQLRIEHSQFARYAIEPPPAEAMESFLRLGYRADDFTSEVFSGAHSGSLRICTFWSDYIYRLYRHRRTGAVIPFSGFPAVSMHQDLTTVSREEIAEEYRGGWIEDALSHLAEEYEDIGPIQEQPFKDNVRTLLAAIPAASPVFVIGFNEYGATDAQGARPVRENQKRYNDYTAEVCAGFPNVTFLAASDYVHGDADLDAGEADHFTRIVYFRIFQAISARLAADREMLAAAAE